MTNISKWVLKREKSMFGHVASFPVGDHALQIQSYSHHSENGAGETTTRG